MLSFHPLLKQWGKKVTPRLTGQKFPGLCYSPISRDLYFSCHHILHEISSALIEPRHPDFGPCAARRSQGRGGTIAAGLQRTPEARRAQNGGGVFRSHTPTDRAGSRGVASTLWRQRTGPVPEPLSFFWRRGRGNASNFD